VPGANDSGSGVVVLLELARIIPDELNLSVRLVFFDAEDNGGIEDWDWILGSRGYADNMSTIPDAVIILDMIGDEDLTINKEYNSDPALMEQIWNQADELGYNMIFLDEYKHSMLDDHTPFVEAGIPAVDIIDFDYPYWHTTADTSDKVSPVSLQIVGDTIYHWLLSLD
jgi:Zn-dependent M28 family amino/carboxypeptidase